MILRVACCHFQNQIALRARKRPKRELLIRFESFDRFAGKFLSKGPSIVPSELSGLHGASGSRKAV